LPPKNKIYTITAEKVFSILSTKNNDVIDSLGLSYSDSIKSLNDPKLYIPVFICEELGILKGNIKFVFLFINRIRIIAMMAVHNLLESITGVLRCFPTVIVNWRVVRIIHHRRK
jgi:hypothetical protein